MKLKITLGVAVWLAVAPLHVMAAGVSGLNIYKNVLVLSCSEKIYRVDKDGRQGPAIHTGNIQIVDFGDSFFAMSTDNDAVAFSGRLSALEDNNFRSASPYPGIAMAKGGRKQEGVYLYMKMADSIVWDCRA